jgi:cytochrome oxidase Cu insertion factor (SCO1/SenC/PrrC family)
MTFDAWLRSVDANDDEAEKLAEYLSFLRFKRVLSWLQGLS